MSSNVNTRIQKFYTHGRQRAVDDIMEFLDQLAERLGDKPLPQDMTAGQFVQTMERIMGEHFGRTPKGR